MACLLDPKGAVGPELQRLLRGVTEGALAAFQEPDANAAVHEARKACKRARAILALARGGADGASVRRLRRRYRDAARAVAALRDAHVMERTLATLGREEAAQELLGSTGEVADAEARRLACQRQLRRALVQVEALEWSGLRWATVLRNLRRSYTSVRALRRPALSGPSQEALHEWRKAVKAWGYHLQLLEPLWPAVLAGLAAEVDLLQELLGQHHDLEVLGQRARAHDKGLAAPLLDGALPERESELLAQIEAVSRPIVALRPRTMEALLGELRRSARR